MPHRTPKPFGSCPNQWRKSAAIFVSALQRLPSSRAVSQNPTEGPPMPSNILVLSASVGAGHMRAAQAVELALRQLAPEANVRNIDVLTLTNAAFRRIYGKAYLDLVNLAPHVLGYVYDLLDKPRDPDSTR